MMSGIKDLSKAYASKHGVTIAEAEVAIKKVLGVIEDAIVDGGVSIIGSFTIASVVRAERVGRNPLTKEEFTIPERVGLRIKCGKHLNAKLNP